MRRVLHFRVECASLNTLGTLLYTTSSTYDNVSGWLQSTTGSTGVVTTYEYDDFGAPSVFDR